jgi:hypothetical protein
MKKYLAFAAVTALNLTAVLPAFAAGGGGSVQLCPQNASGLCELTIGTVITKGIELVLVVALILAFVFLVIGGIRWIMSGGDKQGTEAAKGTITAALIGLVIVFLAWALLNLIRGFFGGPQDNTFNLDSITVKGGK